MLIDRRDPPQHWPPYYGRSLYYFFISVKWTFNGDEIGDTETLTIKEITEDNVGTYACNVSNRAGNLQN